MSESQQNLPVQRLLKEQQRRIDALEQRLREAKGRRDLRATPRYVGVGKTMSSGTYPTDGNTFEFVFTELSYTKSAGTQSQTYTDRSASAHGVGQSLDSRYINKGTKCWVLEQRNAQYVLIPFPIELYIKPEDVPGYTEDTPTILWVKDGVLQVKQLHAPYTICASGASSTYGTAVIVPLDTPHDSNSPIASDSSGEITVNVSGAIEVSYKVCAERDSGTSENGTRTFLQLDDGGGGGYADVDCFDSYINHMASCDGTGCTNVPPTTIDVEPGYKLKLMVESDCGSDDLVTLAGASLTIRPSDTAVVVTPYTLLTAALEPTSCTDGLIEGSKGIIVIDVGTAGDVGRIARPCGPSSVYSCAYNFQGPIDGSRQLEASSPLFSLASPFSVAFWGKASGNTTGAARRFLFEMRSGNARFQIFTGYAASLTRLATQYAGAPSTSGNTFVNSYAASTNCNHYVITWDGTTLRTYVNGALEEEDASGSSNWAYTEPADPTIGRWTYGSNINSFTIWQFLTYQSAVPLSVAEQLYNGGAGIDL